MCTLCVIPSNIYFCIIFGFSAIRKGTAKHETMIFMFLFLFPRIVDWLFSLSFLAEFGSFTKISPFCFFLACLFCFGFGVFPVRSPNPPLALFDFERVSLRCSGPKGHLTSPNPSFLFCFWFRVVCWLSYLGSLAWDTAWRAPPQQTLSLSLYFFHLVSLFRRVHLVDSFLALLRCLGAWRHYFPGVFFWGGRGVFSSFVVCTCPVWGFFFCLPWMFWILFLWATARGPVHWGPVHTRESPWSCQSFSRMKQPSRSSTSGERSSLQWKNTQQSLMAKQLLHGVKGRAKLQTLILSPLYSWPVFSFG